MSPSHNNSYSWSSYDPRIRRRSWIAVLLVQLLLILVLFYFGYNYLVARIEKVVFHIEANAMEFMDLLNEPVSK